MGRGHKAREGTKRQWEMDGAQSGGHSGTSACWPGKPEAGCRESCGLTDARYTGLDRRTDEQAGSVMRLGKELRTDGGEAQLTLHVQLGPPAVTLNEDGGAQEGRTAQSSHKGAEHE